MTIYLRDFICSYESDDLINFKSKLDSIILECINPMKHEYSKILLQENNINFSESMCISVLEFCNKIHMMGDKLTIIFFSLFCKDTEGNKYFSMLTSGSIKTHLKYDKKTNEKIIIPLLDEIIEKIEKCDALLFLRKCGIANTYKHDFSIFKPHFKNDEYIHEYMLIKNGDTETKIKFTDLYVAIKQAISIVNFLYKRINNLFWCFQDINKIKFEKQILCLSFEQSKYNLVKKNVDVEYLYERKENLYYYKFSNLEENIGSFVYCFKNMDPVCMYDAVHDGKNKRDIRELYENVSFMDDTYKEEAISYIKIFQTIKKIKEENIDAFNLFVDIISDAMSSKIIVPDNIFFNHVFLSTFSAEEIKKIYTFFFFSKEKTYSISDIKKISFFKNLLGCGRTKKKRLSFIKKYLFI